MVEEKPEAKKKNNGKSTIKSYGPISDLEQFVKPDWWRNIFNRYYLKTDGDVVEDREITKKEMDLFLATLSPDKDDRILDLCCGQGRHSIELANRGFKNIEGLDRSHYLIQRAKAISRKSNLGIKFREGDARKLPYPPDTFDIVLILGNSFGYFETIQDDLMVLKEVFRVLKPWGKVLIDVADGDYVRQNFQTRSWEWIDKKHFVCRERSLSLDNERLISREVISNVDEGVLSDQFYAERLYNKENLRTYLEKIGFKNIEFSGEISTVSQRNQDLGMMAQRIIVTGIVKKDWAKVKIKPELAVKNVAVIMGDPNQSDPIKPCHIFDDDDMYTIDQLKSVAKDIKKYNFIYLNNHDNLINDLIQNKNKFDYVFNLCDEGYFNDPTKELHVAAILEILKIPYTGGSPQCLAICYDKSLVRGLAIEMGIPVPDALFIKPEDTSFELPTAFPVLVKPNFGDSSFGITQNSVANNSEEFIRAVTEIRDKFGYDKPILVEEFLTGKDISVGIIGNPPESYTVLPIIEEDYSSLPEDLPKICGYEAKWLPDSPYWNITSVLANMPQETENEIIEYCIKLFERLGCRDYARFDWRLNSEGKPKLLEVNPNPGWCWDGHLAKMAKFSGMSYGEMIEAILKAAEQRIGNGAPRQSQ
jgi:D-alanine-D-alanine ligase